MEAVKRDRFLKLLKMTGSNHDGEALNAMRKASQMLQDMKLQWDDVIVGAVQTPTPAKKSGQWWADMWVPDENSDVMEILRRAQQDAARRAQEEAKKKGPGSINELLDVLSKISTDTRVLPIERERIVRMMARLKTYRSMNNDDYVWFQALKARLQMV